jgi:tetratricopeptide (TPR) repeat protein
MRNGVVILAGMVMSMALCGCAADKGTEVLYAYEKAVWQARMAEERIWIDPFAVRDDDLSHAIEVYEAVIAGSPLLDRRAENWSPRIRKGIEKLRFSSNVALAKLYFLRLQNNAGVTYFRSGLQRHDLLFRKRRDLGLYLVKAVYGQSNRDALEAKCWSVLADISQYEDLALHASEIGDTLVTVPDYLVRVDVDRGAGDLESVELAERFLGQIIAAQPDSVISQKARMSRVYLYVMLERFDDALREIDAVIAAGRFTAHPNEMYILRSEILGFGLERSAEAEAILEGLSKTFSETDLSRLASLDLAALKAGMGEPADAVRILRDLENSKDTPTDVITTAMFLRAIIMDERGEWGEAVTLLWRICRLYPFTRAGMVAPLVILRQELAEGDGEGAARVHRKTVEYYLSAIAMNSALLRYRHLVKDYLIESYLIMGDPVGAAKLLEERAPAWTGENGAVGLIKSALIYLNLLDDRENGVRMLEKCLDLFPSSRYLGYVRAKLDSLTRLQTVQ